MEAMLYVILVMETILEFILVMEAMLYVILVMETIL